jgi:hypothetical protein
VLDEIILDMDGVLYDWEGTVGDIMIRDGFLLASPERTRTWDVEWMSSDIWSHYHECIEDVFTLGAALPYALDGAEALRMLTTNLHIVTGGPDASREPKLRWLRENGVEFDKFTLIPTDGVNPPDKSDYVTSGNAVVIDDSPNVIDKTISETPATAIVYDQRYNRGVSTPKEHPNSRLFRAYNWNGVYRIAAWLSDRAEKRLGDTTAALGAMT